jgi:hypothetical protein
VNKVLKDPNSLGAHRKWGPASKEFSFVFEVLEIGR